MADIRLTDQKMRTLCLTVLWQCKDFYKKPENMAAYEAWKKEREEAAKNGTEPQAYSN